MLFEKLCEIGGIQNATFRRRLLHSLFCVFQKMNGMVNAGYDSDGIRSCMERELDLEAFLLGAPQMNPNSHLITGSICGVKLAEIDDPMMLTLRRLDKLIDELAKGKPMEKILRKEA